MSTSGANVEWPFAKRKLPFTICVEASDMEETIGPSVSNALTGQLVSNCSVRACRFQEKLIFQPASCYLSRLALMPLTQRSHL